VAMSRAYLGRHTAACRSPAGKAAPPGRRAPKGGSHSQPAGLRLPALGPPVRGFRQVLVASPSCRAPAATVCSRWPPSVYAQLRTHGRRRVSPSRWSHLCNNSLITLTKNKIILHNSLITLTKNKNKIILHNALITLTKNKNKIILHTTTWWYGTSPIHLIKCGNTSSQPRPDARSTSEQVVHNKLALSKAILSCPT
jgi:hypothetical protein